MATLLFLQARGQVTASEVAEELEVSVRTARRDLEALSIAGIPVYSQAGRGGGWSLIGGARTDLTGLTAAEARTLFLLAGPASAVTPEARSALRKLVRALPATFRAVAEKAASAVILDPAAWGDRAPAAPPHLATLQQAVVQGVQVRLGYTDAKGVISERTVHPLGLVSKGRSWYLLADTEGGRRTFRVWRVRSADLTEQPAHRPPGFDLSRAWQEVVDALEEPHRLRVVSLLADPEVLPWLRAHFGSRLTIADDDPGPGGRARVEVRLPRTHDDPARELCGYGDSLEVLGPPEVRRRLGEIGTHLVGCYGSAAGTAGPKPGRAGHARYAGPH